MIVVLIEPGPRYTRIVAAKQGDKRAINRGNPVTSDPPMTAEHIEEYRTHPETYDEVA